VRVVSKSHFQLTQSHKSHSHQKTFLIPVSTMMFQKIVPMLALLLGAMVVAVEGQHTIRAANTLVSSV
jgi:hypothetical protein